LKELGVRDSKLLSRQRRDFLYPEILRLCRIAVPFYIQPAEIDRYVRRGKKYRRLNYLEAIYMAKVVDTLDADSVIVDAADTNPGRFGRDISELANKKCEIVSEHHADRNHVVVSAASIVAKVERDWAVEKLRRKYGDFGSGYPHDARTKEFLLNWLEVKGFIPDFARKSWKSWDNWLQLTL
jgi:ribonuclease HII